MKSAGALAALAAVVAASPSPVELDTRATGSSTGSSTLPTITTRGNAFWDGQTRFYIRGVDYQPGGSSANIDPLANPTTCKRDIQYFTQLGLNTVRVYTVDNSANHDECMSALAEAGIYLVLDVNTPLYSLNRDAPGVSYNPTYLQSVFATIDAFAPYSNTLAFFSGNEVINAPGTTDTAPFIKAVTRDMRQYIGERGWRQIPVGYSAADVSQNQYLMAQYMDCGDEAERSDFYAINNYEWCDPSSFDGSGWNQMVQQYSNYSIPLFLSEYGCIKGTRVFTETAGLYQPDMTVAFSGGLVYQYSEEADNPGFGLVNIKGNSVSIIPQQFNDLKAELAKTPNPSGDGGYVSNNPPQECPGQSANWNTKPFTGSALPACPAGALKYFKNGAGKGPGLKGTGSQTAPGGSTVTAKAGAGQVSATYGSGSGSTSTSSGSAAVSARMVRAELAPLAMCGAVVALSFALGASLL